MLQRIHRIAFYLNQYANLLMVFATVILVSLTAIYVRLTSRTLTALKEASLREREALHFQEIKDNVIRPILSWISGTVFERFTGKGPTFSLFQVVTTGNPGSSPAQLTIHSWPDTV